MVIRTANSSDFNAIQRLNEQIFEYEFQNCTETVNLKYPYIDPGIEYFNKIINQEDGNYGLVYEQEGRVIGYASLRIIKENDLQHRTAIKQVQLQTLCVDTEYRRKNIGYQLVESSKVWAKKQGANNLKVVAMAKNERARNFYRNCGFEEYEIIHEMPL